MAAWLHVVVLLAAITLSKSAQMYIDSEGNVQDPIRHQARLIRDHAHRRNSRVEKENEQPIKSKEESDEEEAEDEDEGFESALGGDPGPTAGKANAPGAPTEDCTLGKAGTSWRSAQAVSEEVNPATKKANKQGCGKLKNTNQTTCESAYFFKCKKDGSTVYVPCVWNDAGKMGKGIKKCYGGTNHFTCKTGMAKAGAPSLRVDPCTGTEPAAATSDDVGGNASDADPDASGHTDAEIDAEENKDAGKVPTPPDTPNWPEEDSDDYGDPDGADNATGASSDPLDGSGGVVDDDAASGNGTPASA